MTSFRSRAKGAARARRISGDGQSPLRSLRFVANHHSAIARPSQCEAPSEAFAVRRISHETKHGGAERDRTADPLLAKQVLSQLSYSPNSLRSRAVPPFDKLRAGAARARQTIAGGRLAAAGVQPQKFSPPQRPSGTRSDRPVRPQQSEDGQTKQAARARHERKRMVGPGRFELPTSPLSGVRSNQLSYGPDFVQTRQPAHRPTKTISHKRLTIGAKLRKAKGRPSPCEASYPPNWRRRSPTGEQPRGQTMSFLGKRNVDGESSPYPRKLEEPP
jgi:hypothetical protein